MSLNSTIATFSLIGISVASVSSAQDQSVTERLDSIEQQIMELRSLIIQNNAFQSTSQGPVNGELRNDTHVFSRTHPVDQSPAMSQYLARYPGATDAPTGDQYYFHRIGVWNIENLSPAANRGFPELRGRRELGPRDSDALREIARYLLDDIAVDALVVTEIHGDLANNRSSQMEELLSHMGGDWRYRLASEGGRQRIGLIFNRERVKIKKQIELREDEYEIQGSDIADRDPMIWWISLLNAGVEYNDLILVGLHLKSQQHNVHNHMAAIAKVFGDLSPKGIRSTLGLPSARDEPEVVVLGDLNDSSHKKRNFKFIFDYAAGLDYIHLGGDLSPYPPTRINGSQIDHIFVSDALLDFVVGDSFRVHGVTHRSQLAAYRATYSDHFPVTFDLINYEE